jgi:hypothetical protein
MDRIMVALDKERKKLHTRIDKALQTWENDNKGMKLFYKKIEEDNKKYLQDALKEQEEFQSIVKQIIEIENTKQCEELIKKIAEDIPSDIMFNNLYSIFQEFMKEEESKIGELKELDDEKIRNVFTEEQSRKAIDLDKEERQLKEDLKDEFHTMTDMIYPFLSLSKDQWSFLWNLASWKSNLLLTKQMKKYTYWVMILTGIVVIFTIILVIVPFFK